MSSSFLIAVMVAQSVLCAVGVRADIPLFETTYLYANGNCSGIPGGMYAEPSSSTTCQPHPDCSLIIDSVQWTSFWTACEEVLPSKDFYLLQFNYLDAEACTTPDTLSYVLGYTSACLPEAGAGGTMQVWCDSTGYNITGYTGPRCAGEINSFITGDVNQCIYPGLSYHVAYQCNPYLVPSNPSLASPHANVPTFLLFASFLCYVMLVIA